MYIFFVHTLPANWTCSLFRFYSKIGAQPTFHRVEDRSTKAEVETPTTHEGFMQALAGINVAQRRPRSKPRRHGALHSQPFRRLSPLNEGRGRNPGDTPSMPDRHSCKHPRSTKAEVETPATLWPMLRKALDDKTAQRRPRSKPRRHELQTQRPRRAGYAQRRPRSKPRRHILWARTVCGGCSRSTKAEVETPATLLIPKTPGIKQ